MLVSFPFVFVRLPKAGFPAGNQQQQQAASSSKQNVVRICMSSDVCQRGKRTLIEVEEWEELKTDVSVSFFAAPILKRIFDFLGVAFEVREWEELRACQFYFLRPPILKRTFDFLGFAFEVREWEELNLDISVSFFTAPDSQAHLWFLGGRFRGPGVGGVENRRFSFIFCGPRIPPILKRIFDFVGSPSRSSSGRS